MVHSRPIVLALDPGENVGAALFCEKGYLRQAICIEGKGTSWDQRVDDAVARLLGWLSGKLVTGGYNTIVIEQPMYMNPRSASSGALVKLSIAMGRIAQVAMDRPYIGHVGWGMAVKGPVKLEQPTPQGWKGQMSKLASNNRVRQIMSQTEIKILTVNESHDWDAVGIGLWYLSYRGVRDGWL